MRHKIAFLLGVLPLLAYAEPRSPAEDKACARVIAVLVKKPALRENYWCDSVELIQPVNAPKGRFYRMAVRGTSKPLPADWQGSVLNGWFAVRQRDGAVYEWDIGDDDAIGRRIDRR